MGIINGQASFTMAFRRFLSTVLVIAGGCAIAFLLSRQNELLRESRDGMQGGGDSGLFEENIIVSEFTSSCASGHSQLSSSSSLLDTISSHSQHHTDVCRNLGAGRTASSIWRAHFHDILEASILHIDEDRIHQNWTKQLLELVTPEFMARALRTSPGYKDIERIMRIIDKRLHNSSAPPLHVGVFGGSVTEGSGCDVIPTEIKKKLKKQPREKNGPVRGRDCAWPYRLQQLADSFLGKEVVWIHNLAAGGTGSEQAQPVLNYWLYPRNSPLRDRGPDVVVNSYSVNDNFHHWKSSNATVDFDHFNSTLKKAHNFLQTALRSRPCDDPPLVLFVDEYFGNTHELLLGEYMRHDAVQFLSNQVKFGYISSSLAVQPFVYANTDETLFSPSWYQTKWDKQKHSAETNRVRDGHFGMPGHVHVAWVLAYSVLKATLDFCEDRQFRDEGLRSSFLSKSTESLVQSDFSPDLTRGVSWTSVSSQWHASDTARIRAEEDFCQSSTSREKPCHFAFITTPAGTVHTGNQLLKYLMPFETSNTGWRAHNDIKSGGWQNKLGLVARKPGASLSLKLKNIENSARFLTLDSLKSYGEKWANSEAQFNITIWSNYTVEHETSFRVKGYHKQNTSISYPYHLDLGEHSAKPGQTVTIDITLVGGTIFKIIALMLCSR